MLTLQAKCPLNHPPGNEIYRKANLSFFEIDGRKNKVCKMWVGCSVTELLYYMHIPLMFFIFDGAAGL